MRRILLTGLVLGLLSAAGCAVENLFERDAPLLLPGQSETPEAPRSERFGVAVVDSGRAELGSLGASWYLNWTYLPGPTSSLEFVPMICAYADDIPVNAGVLAWLRGEIAAHADRYPDGTLWLIGNEIGYRPQRDSRTPEQYASDFRACREMLVGLNPSFRIATGPVILSKDPRLVRGYMEAENGADYLDRVLRAYRSQYDEDLPADFVSATAHVLSRDGVDLDAFKQQVVEFRRFLAERGLRDRRLMISEFGVAHGKATPRAIQDFLLGASRFLAHASDPEIGCPSDAGRLVQRWAWFTGHPLETIEKLQRLGFDALFLNLAQTSLFNRDGRVNHLGFAYREVVRSVREGAAAP